VPQATDAGFERLPSRPLVSVLTPSFNQRRWLPQTVESVASQTYENLEHVVMDGGSTDGSIEFLRDTLRPDSWTSEPDRGQSDALNKAFARSSGEIIGWLNSDDAYLFDDAVATVVDHFRSNPSAEVVYGHAALVSEDDRLLQVMWAPVFDPNLLKRFNFIVQPTIFMRRHVLDEGFADESFHYTMDRELWLRLARKHSFSRIDRMLAIDRHQADRKSYARPDLADAERERLAAMYGLPRGRMHAAESRLRKIAYRVRGARAAFGLSEDGRAFDWTVDGRARLLTRQLVVKRRFMAQGEASAA
jgi:glycosyltransferase involved in cell wall biosynthesis